MFGASFSKENAEILNIWRCACARTMDMLQNLDTTVFSVNWVGKGGILDHVRCSVELKIGHGSKGQLWG